MIGTRMEGRIESLEKVFEEMHWRQQATGDRLIGMEANLHQVTHERLTGIEETLNRILKQIGRGVEQEDTVNGGGRRHQETEG